METYCVYKHTSPSGKVYIGMTKQSPEARWKNGFGYASSKHFYNAITKYGWDNFSHEIIIDNLSVEEACHYEKLFIKFYHSTDRRYGYNCKDGGLDTNALTEESRKKLSQSMKAFYASHPEKREEIRRRVLGYKHTEETKEKMRNCHKHHPEHLTDEWKKNIGEANRKKHDNAAYHEQVSDRCRKNGMMASLPVEQLSLDGKLIARYPSGRAAERATGIKNGNISSCCRKITKTSGGFKWRYAIEIER